MAQEPSNVSEETLPALDHIGSPPVTHTGFLVWRSCYKRLVVLDKTPQMDLSWYPSGQVQNKPTFSPRSVGEITSPRIDSASPARPSHPRRGRFARRAFRRSRRARRGREALHEGP